MNFAILAAAVLVALAVGIALTVTPWARSQAWRATVTPLASIIGSGFLVCGPILAKEFGSAAILAEAVLLAIAYAVGAVIRFNIAHVEPLLAASAFHDRIAWLARITQGVLSLAYAVSVAYYLKLLAEFALRPFHLGAGTEALVSNGLVTSIIGVLVLIALMADMRRIEHIAHGAVTLKLGMIAGLLVALAIWWATHTATDAPPAPRMAISSIPTLLGLIITVQGFETSRYMGHAYEADLRIRTMRLAQ